MLNIFIFDRDETNHKKYKQLLKLDDLAVNLTIIEKNRNDFYENLKKKCDLFILNRDCVDDKEYMMLKEKLTDLGIKLIRNEYFNFSNSEVLTEQINLLLEENNRQVNNIVIIGSSTGGPRALNEIISKLPNTLNSSIIVIQHMPAKFTKSLASRLDKTSSIKVKEAEDGEHIKDGVVYIAPGDFHLKIIQESNLINICLNKEEKHLGLRPAVDITMKSTSKVKGYNIINIILTGMGSDGSIGLKDMQNRDTYNIVQDKDSSIVYGMPRSALETGLIDDIIELNSIDKEIIRRVGC